MSKESTAHTPETKLSIPAPNLRTMRLLIVGDSELICHRFSAKAQKMIADKQQKKARTARSERKPEQEYHDSLYPIEGKKNTFGFPSGAFKAACLFACSHVDGITKVEVKGAFHILGALVELIDPVSGKPSQPYMRVDHVVIGRGIASIAYRGAFAKWACWPTIRYNANVMTAEQIVNLLNTAGFASGIGEWRPSSPMKPGPNGMFHVKEARES
jgi:hypothetical protein